METVPSGQRTHNRQKLYVAIRFKDVKLISHQTREIT